MSEFQAGLQLGEWLSEKSLRPRWNRVKNIIALWSNQLSQNAAKYTIIDLGQATSSWGEYRRKRKQGLGCRRFGFPRFKQRRHEEGFWADNGPDTVRVDGKTVILPKIGRVAMFEYLRLEGRICEVTFNRTAGQRSASSPSTRENHRLRSRTDPPVKGDGMGLFKKSMRTRRSWTR